MSNNLEKCEFKTFFSVYNRDGIKVQGKKSQLYLMQKMVTFVTDIKILGQHLNYLLQTTGCVRDVHVSEGVPVLFFWWF